MNTTSIGREAEALVARHLKDNGHTIIAMNWRTRWCEIDIVSTKKKTVYFTEVKYRSSSLWGGGLDYLGKKKLKQMNYAADFWMAENSWKEDAELLAAEVNSDGDINLIKVIP